jgi:SAM-dependent methyltransferase
MTVLLKNDKLMTWEDAVLWLRQQPEQAQLVRDCFYDDPLLESAERYYLSSEWKAVQDFLTGAVRGAALDLGAGRGISSYALARDGWRVTALEPDKSPVVGTGAIRILANEAKLDITVIEEWGERLPCADKSFDLVHARQVLHHARDLRELCREVYRVLRPRGLFIATREHVISKKEDLQAFLDAHPLHRFYGGEHAYLPAEYIEAIVQAGIELTHVLNTFQSDVNLFPDSRTAFKKRVSARMMWPWPNLIPDALLGLRGALMRKPGRLYSFIGRKPA